MIRDYEGTNLAAAYEILRPDYPGQVRKEILRNLKRKKSLNCNKKTFMLDVGCGGGKSTRIFAKDFDKILGIDISKAQLDMAEKKASGKNITYRLVENEKFPAASNSVDFILCAVALHYMNLQSFLKECNRTLVQGGSVAIVNYIPFAFKTLDGRLIDKACPGSRWEHMIMQYFRGCGMNEYTVQCIAKRYQPIFDAIKSTSKYWAKTTYAERIWTFEEFMDLVATSGGYTNMSSSAVETHDPLTQMRDNIKELFQDYGIACYDHTEFIVTFEYTVVIIDKTDGCRIH